MAEIHELSENLANQIAAGEVIERPASVVKELVENSIDAGSDRIQIEFLDAGLKKIVVQDNGTGIAGNQLDLAFTRHATSKIENEHDLFNVNTLGFRGEALASIAAVSHVEVLTKTENMVGKRAVFDAGIKKTQEDAAAPLGTRITVSDLFYNTPARLKYLRSPRTEIMKIVDIVNRIALGYPQIALTLKNEKRILLKTAGNKVLKQTVASVYGREIAEKMLLIKGSDQDFTISGLISKPELTRSTRNFISILLNGRYINNYQLAKAVMSGYGANLTDRHYPIAVIKIVVDPFLVDVNVHPTKREVRLSKETQISRLITSTISKVLLQKDAQADGLGNLSSVKTETLIDQLKFDLNKDVVETKRRSQIEDEVQESQPLTIKSPQVMHYVDLSIPREDDYYVISKSWSQNVAIQKRLRPFSKRVITEKLTSTGDDVLTNSLPNIEFVGKAGTYLIASNEGDLYLIDQVAARRLLCFEKIKSALVKQKIAQQTLLTPLILNFGNLEFIQISSKLTEIKKIGIFLEDFGQNTFILRTTPTWLQDDSEKEIRTILDYYLNVDQNNSTKLIDRIAANQAQQVVVGKEQLSNLECKDILTKLRKIEDPYHDAKGNVVLIRLRKNELRKMFKKDE